jgi:hypothetical protein
MRYQVEITINLPRSRVVQLMDNAENNLKWQDNLISFDHLSGTPGQEGARTNFVYMMPAGRQDMLETIVTSNFPEEFTATYESRGVWNLNKNFFEEIGPSKTRWIMDAEFKFYGFMNIFLLFGKKGFPKETLKQMNRFKKFAESVNSISLKSSNSII